MGGVTSVASPLIDSEAVQSALVALGLSSTNPLLRRLHVHAEIPVGGERFCYSDPLDDIADFLGLWYALLNEYASPDRNEHSRKQWVEKKSANESEVWTILPDWFLLHVGLDDCRGLTTSDITMKTRVLHDKDAGTIDTFATLVEEGGDTVWEETHLTLHREPLHIQYWGMTPDRRGVGRHLQYWVAEKLTRVCIHAGIKNKNVFPTFSVPGSGVKSVVSEHVGMSVVEFWKLFKKEIFARVEWQIGESQVEFDPVLGERKFTIIRGCNGDLQNANTYGYHPMGQAEHGPNYLVKEVHTYDPPTDEMQGGLTTEISQGHSGHFKDPDFKAIITQYVRFHEFGTPDAPEFGIEAWREHRAFRRTFDRTFAWRHKMVRALEKQAGYFSHDALMSTK